MDVAASWKLQAAPAGKSSHSSLSLRATTE
jgi:hypothetical protein